MLANRTIENNRMKIEEQAQRLNQQQPKVLFAESVAASSTSILIRELAKLISQNGVKIGEKGLFQWLRENGYLIKKLGADYSKEVICTALEQSREVERLRQLRVVLEQLEQHPVVQQYKVTKNKLARERAMRQKRFSKDVTNMSSLNDVDSMDLIYRQFTAQQESFDEYNLRMDLQSDENQPIIQYFLKLRAQIEPSKPIKEPSADKNVETTLNNKPTQQTIQQEQTKPSKTQQNEIAPEIQKVADERSRSFSTYKPVESEPITIEPIDIPAKGAKPIEESTPTEQRTRKASYREIDYSKSVDKSTAVAEPTPTRPSLTKQQREEQVRRQQQEEQRLREIAQKKALEEEEKEPDDGLSL